MNKKKQKHDFSASTKSCMVPENGQQWECPLYLNQQLQLPVIEEVNLTLTARGHL